MRLLLILMIIASQTTYADAWYEGKWEVLGAKFPGISAIGMEEVKPYIGKSETISKSALPLKNSSCNTPTFEESTVSQEDFILVYGVMFEDLGFSEGDVNVVHAHCENRLSFIFSHIIQNSGVTYGVWEGAYIQLEGPKL